MPDLDETIKEI